MRKPWIAALMLAVATLPAAAQSFAKAEDAVAYRQGAFRMIGVHFGQLASVAKGELQLSPAQVRANAEVLAYLSQLPFNAFTAQGNSRALPEVWSKPAEFQAQADKFKTATQALSVAAQSGNVAQMKAAVGQAGQTCKSCHDAFRKP